MSLTRSDTKTLGEFLDHLSDLTSRLGVDLGVDYRPHGGSAAIALLIDGEVVAFIELTGNGYEIVEL